MLDLEAIERDMDSHDEFCNCWSVSSCGNEWRMTVESLVAEVRRLRGETNATTRQEMFGPWSIWGEDYDRMLAFIASPEYGEMLDLVWNETGAEFEARMKSRKEKS